MKELFKTKTFWTGILGVIAGAGAYYTGDMDKATTIQTVLGSLIAIFMRNGMLK